MKKLVAFFAAFLLIVLTACGTSNEENANNSTNENESENKEAALQTLEVKFLTESDAFAPQKEGKIEVKVTQGDKNVTDAEEVMFEIWKKGHQDESKKYDAKHEKDGVYALEHTFDKGAYKVISHVTANQMHTMPTRTFTVGDVEENSEHGHHGDHGEVITIMLMKPDDAINANEKTTLMAHLQKENKPLTGAEVTFEYWQEGQEKHTFVETKEAESGNYNGEVTFEKPGTYTVKTHVTKGEEIHTHKEETVEVK